MGEVKPEGLHVHDLSFFLLRQEENMETEDMTRITKPVAHPYCPIANPPGGGMRLLLPIVRNHGPKHGVGVSMFQQAQQSQPSAAGHPLIIMICVTRPRLPVRLCSAGVGTLT